MSYIDSISREDFLATKEKMPFAFWTLYRPDSNQDYGYLLFDDATAFYLLNHLHPQCPCLDEMGRIRFPLDQQIPNFHGWYEFRMPLIADYLTIDTNSGRGWSYHRQTETGERLVRQDIPLSFFAHRRGDLVVADFIDNRDPSRTATDLFQVIEPMRPDIYLDGEVSGTFLDFHRGVNQKVHTLKYGHKLVDLKAAGIVGEKDPPIETFSEADWDKVTNLDNRIRGELEDMRKQQKLLSEIIRVHKKKIDQSGGKDRDAIKAHDTATSEWKIQGKQFTKSTDECMSVDVLKKSDYYARLYNDVYLHPWERCGAGWKHLHNYWKFHQAAKAMGFSISGQYFLDCQKGIPTDIARHFENGASLHIKNRHSDATSAEMDYTLYSLLNGQNEETGCPCVDDYLDDVLWKYRRMELYAWGDAIQGAAPGLRVAKSFWTWLNTDSTNEEIRRQPISRKFINNVIGEMITKHVQNFADARRTRTPLSPPSRLKKSSLPVSEPSLRVT